MRTIKFLLMMIGISVSCMLYAQEYNSKQNENNNFEGIKVGTRRNYSRTKTGFFAPYGLSLGVGYDYETLRFSYDDYSNKPLNGVKISFLINCPLIGILSIENSTGFRYNYVKDTQLGKNYESLTRWEYGIHWGLLLSTGYNFRKFHITISGGALLDFCLDNTTLKKNSGEEIEIGNVGYEDTFTKMFDIPISFAATFRYKSLGVRVNYDIGTINRYKEDYYEKMGVPKSYTKKNNHFCVGIQYYFSTF